MKLSRLDTFEKGVLLCIALLFIRLSTLYSQSFISEEFNTWPPPGWTIENQANNWSTEFSVQAGGQPPEAKLSGTPVFFNVTRLVSPLIDLTGHSLVKLEFNHTVLSLSPGYTIGVATRNGNGPWTTVWSTPVYSAIVATLKSLFISNNNANQPNFQFCLYFLGNSQNLNTWYIDNVRLFVPPAHDLALESYVSQVQYQAGDSLKAKVRYRNLGLNGETAIPITLYLFDSDNTLLFSDTKTVTSPAGGNADTLEFLPFKFTQSNKDYLLRVIASLATDMNHSNDTLVKAINTYALIDRKFVLVELGTVTWCQHCPAAAQTVDNMLIAGDTIAVVGYHGGYGDPFNNPASDERLNYYNILGFPTAYFDGTLGYTGSSNISQTYPAYYDQRKSVDSPVDLQIFGNHSGNNYNLTVVSRRISPMLLTHFKLHLALTESHIPYTWHTQNEVNHAVRLMIPSAGGTNINLAMNPVNQQYLSFQMNPAWNVSNCELIAFLQDTLTKEVYQVDKVNLNNLQPLVFGTVNGTVRYDNPPGTPLGVTTVKLMQTGFVVKETQTNSQGQYTFTNVVPGHYTLSATSTLGWGGSNATDALLILKSFVLDDGLSELRLRAGDVDVSSYLNSIDALTVSRRFVGLISTFGNGDWVFESPTINVLPGITGTKNFKGLCSGDVDGSYIPIP